MLRRCLLWLSILVVLPCAARAGGGIAVDASSPVGDRVLVLADAGPLLDLSLDPGLENQMSAAPPYGASGAPGEAVPPVARREASFSVGIDIKTRREGNSASRAAAEPEGPQTLTDKVEGVVRRSTFGVTGTYRF